MTQTVSQEVRATFAEVSPQVSRITGIAPTDWIEVGQNTPSHISLSDALKELGISDRQLMKYRLIARKIKPYWDSALQRNPDYPLERKKQLEQKLKGGYVQASYVDEPPFTWFEFLVRHQERQQKLNQIQSIKTNGLDFLRRKYGVNPQQRASQANERFTQIKQELDSLDLDVESFFSRR